MKLPLFIILLCVILSKLGLSQTLQASNALYQKDKSIKPVELSPIDPLPQLDFSLSKDSSVIIPINKTPLYLNDLQNDILSVWSAINSQNTLSAKESNNYKKHLEKISSDIIEMKDSFDSLSKETNPERTKELEKRIESLQNELLTNQASITKLTNDNVTQLKNNKFLKNKLVNLNKSFTNKLNEIETDNSELIRTVYKLRLKLNEPDLQGIFRSYKEALRKYEEIQNNLDTVNWFIGKSFSSEDGIVIKNEYDKLKTIFTHLGISKEQQQLDSSNFSKVLETYKKVDILFGKDISNFNKKFMELDRQLDSQYKVSAKSFRKFKSELDTYTQEYKKTLDKINPILTRYAKKESKDQYYSVFGGFKKILEDQGAFIPEINVFAQKKFGEESYGGYGQIRLFTGAGVSNNNINSLLNYFVPEASSYGVVTDLGLGFSINNNGTLTKNMQHRIKDLGINTSFYLMGKNLSTSDSTIIKPNVGLWKIGLEVLPFQNFFSLRANINGLFIANKVEDVKNNFAGSSNNYWYTDLAFTTLLNIAETQNFKLKFDLNLIFLNQKMKAFLNSNDNILPQIKLELVAGF